MGRTTVGKRPQVTLKEQMLQVGCVLDTRQAVLSFLALLADMEFVLCQLTQLDDFAAAWAEKGSCW